MRNPVTLERPYGRGRTGREPWEEPLCSSSDLPAEVSDTTGQRSGIALRSFLISDPESENTTNEGFILLCSGVIQYTALVMGYLLPLPLS